MKRSITLFTVLLVFAIFALPSHAGPPGPPEPYVAPVNVVNEPNVQVTSMPDVTIANTPLPVTVANQTKQVEVKDALFRQYILPDGSERLEIINSVPPGKIFVLTDIDVRCEFGCPGFMLQLTDKVDSTSSIRYDISIQGDDVTHDSLQLTSGITFSPEHEVYAIIYNNGLSEKLIQVLASGYLVDE